MTDQPTTWTTEIDLAIGGVVDSAQDGANARRWPMNAVKKLKEVIAAEIERQKARLRVFDGLLVELCSLFGWEDETELHAALHIGNAVRNMQADKATAEEEVERLRAELAAKQPAEAEAAQQGPSDEAMDAALDACVEDEGCSYCVYEALALLWERLRKLQTASRREGVKL